MISQAEKDNDREFAVKFQQFVIDNGEGVISLEREAEVAKREYEQAAVALGENRSKVKKSKSREILGQFELIFRKMGECLKLVKGN